MKKIVSGILSVAMLCTSLCSFASPVQAATVEENLKAQGFTAQYVEKLAPLQTAHPNWKFVAFNTGLNFEDAVKGELAGTPTTEENLRYYLDPLNWLNEKYIFQFGKYGRECV